MTWNPIGICSDVHPVKSVKCKWNHVKSNGDHENPLKICRNIWSSCKTWRWMSCVMMHHRWCQTLRDFSNTQPEWFILWPTDWIYEHAYCAWGHYYKHQNLYNIKLMFNGLQWQCQLALMRWHPHPHPTPPPPSWVVNCQGGASTSATPAFNIYFKCVHGSRKHSFMGNVWF